MEVNMEVKTRARAERVETTETTLLNPTVVAKTRKPACLAQTRARRLELELDREREREREREPDRDHRGRDGSVCASPSERHSRCRIARLHACARE